VIDTLWSITKIKIFDGHNFCRAFFGGAEKMLQLSTHGTYPEIKPLVDQLKSNASEDLRKFSKKNPEKQAREKQTKKPKRNKRKKSWPFKLFQK